MPEKMGGPRNTTLNPPARFDTPNESSPQPQMPLNHPSDRLTRFERNLPRRKHEQRRRQHKLRSDGACGGELVCEAPHCDVAQLALIRNLRRLSTRDSSGFSAIFECNVAVSAFDLDHHSR